MMDARAHTIRELQQQLRRLQRSPRRKTDRAACGSTGIAELDALLPEGGLTPGTLVEWLAGETAGGMGTLVFKIAARLCRAGEACIVIDSGGLVYPPAVSRLGIDLDAVIMVRPEQARRGFRTSETIFREDDVAVGSFEKGEFGLGAARREPRPPINSARRGPRPGDQTASQEILWAWEQSLRCCGVAVVIGRLDRLSSHDFRRLQLAAEAGGGIGMLLRSVRNRDQPSWADLRLYVEPHPGTHGTVTQAVAERPPPLPRSRLLRVELVHSRGLFKTGTLLLEIDDETGAVHHVPRLAAAAAVRRSAGA